MWTYDILGGLQVTKIKTRNWGIMNCVKVCKDFANALKGAGSFHIHRKIMKDLCALAVLGIRE